MTTPLVLRPGMSAVYDSFGGLVPVKILSITGPDTDSPIASSAYTVKARVSRSHTPYRWGEIIEGTSLHFAPRAAVRIRQGHTSFVCYGVSTRISD